MPARATVLPRTAFRNGRRVTSGLATAPPSRDELDQAGAPPAPRSATMTDPAALRFCPDYEEEVALDDGSRVTLRLVRPGDKPLLLDGFAHLSPESRYRRFLGPKNNLSAAELRYLTECDGVDHFALGAVRRDDAGEHGLGVGRIIRLRDRPDTAEAAVTVVDEAQGRGLGRLLGERLVAAAQERGIHRFRVLLLAGNERARSLLDEVAPSDLLKPPVESEGGSLTFEVELPPPPPPRQPGWRDAWRHLLSLAARAYAITRGADSP